MEASNPGFEALLRTVFPEMHRAKPRSGASRPGSADALQEGNGGYLMEFEHGLEWYLWNFQLGSEGDVINVLSIDTESPVRTRTEKVETAESQPVELRLWTSDAPTKRERC